VAAGGVLTDYSLELNRVGGAYADALNTQTNDTFRYLQDLLGDGSTPTDWVKNGLALWIQGLQRHRDLHSSIYSILCGGALGSAGAGTAPASPAGLTPRANSQQPGPQAPSAAPAFKIDRFSQAADPIPTTIPLADVNSVKASDLRSAAGGVIPKKSVEVASSDGLVVVFLANLPKNLPADTYQGTLTFGRPKKQMVVTVVKS
jgi:hypothetical protein